MQSLPAFARLAELARTPYDLTRQDALPPQRISDYSSSMCDYDLLYATQRVTGEVLDFLQELADQSGCVDMFMHMKKGGRINRIEGYPSENRQVLHTASRDIFSDTPLAAEATAQARTELEKLQNFLQDLETGKISNATGESFTHLVNVGIGGSDLGPRAVYHALEAFRIRGRSVSFISNVDPDDAAAVLENLDLSRTLVNVVSKSGSTLETLTNEELVREAFIQRGLKPEKHFIAVTGEKSPMDNPNRYLRSFYMFEYIGGRYSTSSMVGGVMLGFALGYENFMEFLRGAHEVDKAGEEKNIRRNIPLLMALLGIWNHNFLGHETLAILPYSQALIRFTAHLQQCDMESNGKSITRTGAALPYQSGPVVWGEPGTNGQHAFYQLIHQGTTIVPVEFIGFRNNQRDLDILIKQTTSQEKLLANLLAQTLALATGQPSENPNRTFPGNRPSSILLTDRLTPRRMGALLAIYETKIVMQGFIWNINSFDQEGVQLGKILADQLLTHCIAKRENPQYSGQKADSTGWALLKTAAIIK